MNQAGFIKFKLLDEGAPPGAQDFNHTNSVFGLNPSSKVAQYMIQTYSVQDVFEFQLSEAKINFFPSHNINEVPIFNKKLDKEDDTWILKEVNFTMSYKEKPQSLNNKNKINLVSEQEEFSNLKVCFTNRLNFSLTFKQEIFDYVYPILTKALCGDQVFPCPLDEKIYNQMPSLQLVFNAELIKNGLNNQENAIALSLLPSKYVFTDDTKQTILDIGQIKPSRGFDACDVVAGMNFYETINLVFRIYKEDANGNIQREITFYQKIDGSPLGARIFLTVLVNFIFLVTLFVGVSRAAWDYKKNEKKQDGLRLVGDVKKKKASSMFLGEPMDKSVNEFKQLRQRGKVL